MNQIARLRKDAGLTQARLAELAGTTQPQIRRLENGDRELTKRWAERLAPHLNVTPERLLFPEGHPKDSIDKMLEDLPPEFADELHEEFERQVMRTRKLIELNKGQ